MRGKHSLETMIIFIYSCPSDDASTLQVGVKTVPLEDLQLSRSHTRAWIVAISFISFDSFHQISLTVVSCFQLKVEWTSWWVCSSVTAPPAGAYLSSRWDRLLPQVVWCVICKACFGLLYGIISFFVKLSKQLYSEKDSVKPAISYHRYLLHYKYLK